MFYGATSFHPPDSTVQAPHAYDVETQPVPHVVDGVIESVVPVQLLSAKQDAVFVPDSPQLLKILQSILGARLHT